MTDKRARIKETREHAIHLLDCATEYIRKCRAHVALREYCEIGEEAENLASVARSLSFIAEKFKLSREKMKEILPPH